jgi:prepilin-type N-terminal cleavage/methylation domain-containing protein
MSRLEKFRARVHRDDGFTLIEMLITISIMSIMMVVSISAVAILFESQTQSMNQFAQQQTMQETSGFFNSRLGAASTIALKDDSSAYPLSISGDQLVFVSSGKCYRVFYVKDSKQLRYKVADDCADLTPTRGPNESGSSPADGVLDSASASNVLAQNVVSTPTSNAPAGSPDPLQVFTYLDADGNVIQDGPDSAASSTATHSAWYDVTDNLEDIKAVNITLYLAQGSGSKTSQRYFQTTIYLGQIPASFNPGGSGTTYVGQQTVQGLDATSSTTAFYTLPSGGGNYNMRLNAATDQPILETEVLPTGNVDVNYDGFLTLTAPDSSPRTIRIRVYLLRADSSGNNFEIRDSFGIDNVTGPPNGPVTEVTDDFSAGKKVSFSGSYSLPFRTTQDASTQYKLRVFAENTTTEQSDSSKNFTYSTKSNELNLHYTATARS